MCFAGLRGAVSYALSTQLVAGDRRGIEAIQTTTMGIIVCTTFILGGSTERVLDRLKLKNSADDASSPRNEHSYGYQLHEDYANGGGASSTSSALHSNLSSSFLSNPSSHLLRRNSFHSWWRNFDDKFMKPAFGGDNEYLRMPPESDQLVQDLSHA